MFIDKFALTSAEAIDRERVATTGACQRDQRPLGAKRLDQDVPDEPVRRAELLSLAVGQLQVE